MKSILTALGAVFLWRFFLVPVALAALLASFRLVPVGASLLLAGFSSSRSCLAVPLAFCFLWVVPAQAQLVVKDPCVETERMKQALIDVFWDSRLLDLEGSEAALYVAGFSDKVRIKSGTSLRAVNVEADRVLVLVLRGRAVVMFSKDGQVCDQRYDIGLDGHAVLLRRALGQAI